MDEEEAAWTAWWRHLWPRAQSWLRTCAPAFGLSPAEREDLVAEAFTRAWERRGRYTAGRLFSTWFYTVLRNLALDQARGRRVRRGLASVTGDPGTDPAEAARAGPWAEPEASFEAAQDQAFLEAFLKDQPPLLAELAWYRYAEDLSLAEISAVTGRPLGTVKSDFHDLRQRLAAVWRARTGKEDP